VLVALNLAWHHSHSKGPTNARAVPQLKSGVIVNLEGRQGLHGLLLELRLGFFLSQFLREVQLGGLQAVQAM